MLLRRLLLSAFLVLPLLVATAHAAGGSGPVAFQIQARESDSGGDRLEWLASAGETRFIIALDLRALSNADARTLSKGSIRHVPGSKPQAFLHQLATVLTLASEPHVNHRSEALEFSAVIVGTQMSQSATGFAASPSGDWIVAKVFLPNSEGEVLLALSPSSGKGQFLVADPAASEPLARELAAVL